MTHQNHPEDAAAWHVRLRSDAADEGDFAAFEAWVSRPENRLAYDSLDRTVALLETDSGALAAALADLAPAPRPRFRPALAWRLGVPAALAAAAALVMAPLLQEHWTTFATAGAPREIRLEDGSVISLNRNSELRVSLEQGRRRASLQGEAVFNVAHDAARPFTIAAGDTAVRVLGTEFNVLHTQNRTAVTVRRGVVRVSFPGGETRLAAGEQCIAAAGDCPARQIDPENVFAWRSGRLVYQDAALGDVFADLNRYYPRRVQAADPATEALRFSGVLVLDEEDKIVARLEAFLPVVATREADAIVFSRAQPR